MSYGRIEAVKLQFRCEVFSSPSYFPGFCRTRSLRRPRGRDNGHQLLAQHIEGIARETRRLDVAVVHGARDRGAGNQVGAVLGKENPLAHRVHMMAGPADALHSTGHRWRRLDLNDKIHGAHVDAELERRGRTQRFDLSGLELFFDHGALRGGERTVMRAGDGLACQIVERSGKTLGGLSRVDKENGRVALANDFEQARMNRVPDGDAARGLRGRPRGNLFHLTEARHVLDRNLDAQLELLARGGVDDGDGPVAERRGVGHVRNQGTE